MDIKKHIENMEKKHGVTIFPDFEMTEEDTKDIVEEINEEARREREEQKVQK